MGTLEKEQLAALIDEAAEKAAEKAVRAFNQEEYEAAMKQRKRGKKHEQIEESESFR